MVPSEAGERQSRVLLLSPPPQCSVSLARCIYLPRGELSERVKSQNLRDWIDPTFGQTLLDTKDPEGERRCSQISKCQVNRGTDQEIL